MNKYVFIFLAAFFTNVFSQDIPMSWIDSSVKQKSNDRLSSYAVEKVKTIMNTHSSLINRLDKKFSNLDRLDVAVGINSSGSIGLFSIGKSKTIELVWIKDKKKEDSSNDIVEKTIYLTPEMNEADINDQLVQNMREVINFHSLRRGVQRTILKTLYKDASRVNRFVKKLYVTRHVGNIYIKGFWSQYFFSSSFGLLDNLSVGYSKRVRFRFDLPALDESSSSIGKPSAYLAGLMKNINKVAQRDNHNDEFDFYRVWADMNIEVGTDLLIFSKSVGKGFLVDFRKTDRFADYPNLDKTFNFGTNIVNAISNQFNGKLKNINKDGTNFPLSQVRYSFLVSKELDLMVASLEKTSEIDFHFKRKTNKEKKVTNVVERVEPINVPFRLKQIDYRHRAAFSFGIPFINRVRIRPSYEYRYRTK
jgi:hypothetical protein